MVDFEAVFCRIHLFLSNDQDGVNQPVQKTGNQSEEIPMATLLRIGKQAGRVVLVALSLLALFLTINAGRGPCPQCGYQNDLHRCKHCGWTACLACWQETKHSH